MKKFILKNLIILLSFNTVLAQTATDFITDDCNGVSHSLFDSLNAGNVIVLAWVMPCGPCATYTLPAYSAVQSFATSHPDRVDFYLVDDYANTACPTLVNWGISNSMSTNTAFSSTSSKSIATILVGDLSSFTRTSDQLPGAAPKSNADLTFSKILNFLLVSVSL